MKGCIKFKNISELPDEVREKIYSLRLTVDTEIPFDEYMEQFDNIVVENCMYHSDTLYAQNVAIEYKLAEEKHRKLSAMAFPTVVIKNGIVIKNRYGCTETPNVKPEPVYVIEALLAPGYWEIATDLYYTDEESAEADKKSLEDGMKKNKRNVSYRIKKLENGTVEP